jgi:hypothetical protein
MVKEVHNESRDKGPCDPIAVVTTQQRARIASNISSRSFVARYTGLFGRKRAVD